MTAPHVIEKLKNTDNWLVVAKNDHEIALMHNILLDLKCTDVKTLTSTDLNCCMFKMSSAPSLSTCRYDFIGCMKLINKKDLDDLSGWFFREVNNY